VSSDVVRGDIRSLRLLPATTRSSTKVVNLMSGSRPGSSDISVYHADFHEGHGTVGEWQGHGMVYVNLPLL
jgi:hypothetical protein